MQPELLQMGGAGLNTPDEKKQGRQENDYGKLLLRSLQSDSKTVHILWNCRDSQCISLGRAFLPDLGGNPLEALERSGYISQESLSVFSVLRSQIDASLLGTSHQDGFSAELMMKLSGDEAFSLHNLYALPLFDESGKACFVHINIRPFSEKEVFERKVLGVFSSDKAPRFFGERISRMMKKFEDKGIAFIQFDVERFKLINDNCGVETGDELLGFFNESLKIICSDDQPFCRLTADVFMIVIAFDKQEDILGFVHKLDSMLSGYKGMDYRLVFGVAVVEDRSLHTRRLGDNATLARQSVKGNALNNIGFYDNKLKSELYHRQNIEYDMTQAMLDDEFAMFLQPKHCISDGRIIGAEALARWIHHDKGMISPMEFIPVFEKNGFILKLDKLMWEKACRQLREWIDLGIEPVPISVNISREYINSYDVVGMLLSLLKKYSLPIELLQLEITESVDNEGASDIVSKMKSAGFTMLMDDFGSGYSSLNMLKTTRFDVLKIDRGFLSEFMESDRGRKIIAHTISMSKDIGLDIIAEGVETSEQADFLSSCGCDKAQGFFYSKPLPVTEFNKKLAEING